MKIPYFCCIGAELKRYAKDFDFMNQVYLYKVPTDDSIEEVLAEDYFKAISDSVLQDDLVYIYEASADTLHSCKFDKQNGHITAVPLASDETLTGAVTTIIHDNLTKNRAVISNNDGKVAVSEVTTTELGYLSGATSNIQTQLSNKASKDLDNLTSKGANIGNWSSNVTNCITEIPQDIKLELNAGALTLKAGSKVYVPNGVGVFDTYTAANDITSNSFAGSVTRFVFVDINNNTINAASAVFSGTTAPTLSGTGFWYDTTNNVIKRTTDSGATWTAGYSFPIAIVTSVSDVATSIDQMFNGFGYIGSTVFALPGVKGLYPDGKNTDGTLKSGAINITEIKTYTISSTTTKAIRIASAGLFGYQGYIISDIKPSVNFNMWYNPVENIMYDTGSGTVSSMNASVAGSVNYDGTRITSFNPKTVFHAIDYNDTDFIAHQAMPSDRYVDLTLGTSGATYTAPADGYYCLRKQMSGANKYLMIQNVSKNIQTNNYSVAEGNVLRLIMPVSKNDTITVTYDTTGTTDYFKFIYANGAK